VKRSLWSSELGIISRKCVPSRETAGRVVKVSEEARLGLSPKEYGVPILMGRIGIGTPLVLSTANAGNQGAVAALC
jgi:hypothetical protein